MGKLVNLANLRGGPDNITVVVARVTHRSGVKPARDGGLHAGVRVLNHQALRGIERQHLRRF